MSIIVNPPARSPLKLLYKPSSAILVSPRHKILSVSTSKAVPRLSSPASHISNKLPQHFETINNKSCSSQSPPCSLDLPSSLRLKPSARVRDKVVIRGVLLLLAANRSVTQWASPGINLNIAVMFDKVTGKCWCFWDLLDIGRGWLRDRFEGWVERWLGDGLGKTELGCLWSIGGCWGEVIRWYLNSVVSLALLARR